jgi:hypothetical protein
LFPDEDGNIIAESGRFSYKEIIGLKLIDNITDEIIYTDETVTVKISNLKYSKNKSLFSKLINFIKKIFNITSEVA